MRRPRLQLMEEFADDYTLCPLCQCEVEVEKLEKHMDRCFK